jgi:hypothetical protein
MDDREILIRQSVILEEIAKRVATVETSVNIMKDSHVVDMKTKLAVQEERLGRLEKIIYGFGTVIVGLIATTIKLWLQKT